MSSTRVEAATRRLTRAAAASGDARSSSSQRPSTWYAGFSHAVSRLTGRPLAFVVAALVIVVWAISGPIFGFSDTWQLVINTGTTIITFLMVFVIQATQNRDTEAMQIKLDELIRCTRGAHNALLDLEELDPDQLDEFRARYEQLAKDARLALERGLPDTDTPDCKPDPDRGG